jgi:DnaJ-class molecular chaperone
MSAIALPIEHTVTGTCFHCKGWGYHSASNVLSRRETCATCGGSGRLTGPPCTECKGTGDGWISVDRHKGYARCRKCNGSGVQR